jgi:hypothetical protein
MFHLMPYRDVPADFEQLSPPPHHVVVVVATPGRWVVARLIADG